MIQPTQNKEQAILEAAECEFLEKGFDSARTTSIAAAAGVTHAMLHYYFRTKENIFERILDEKMRVMGESILSAFGEPGLPLMERIKKGISVHFDFLIENPCLPRFIINEVSSNPERYEMMRRRVLPIATALVNSAQRELDELSARGEIEQVDIRQLILDILSLNIFVFIAYPVIAPILMGDDPAGFLRQRKAENIEMVMRRLKKIDL